MTAAPFLLPTISELSMIRFDQIRLTDAGRVVSLDAASCATELSIACQLIEQPGVGYSTYLRMFPCHTVHPLFVKSIRLILIILHVSSQNSQLNGSCRPGAGFENLQRVEVSV